MNHVGDAELPQVKVMQISREMKKILDEIYFLEGDSLASLINRTANELGNNLISVYYGSDNAVSKKLVKLFLSKAGAVWLRKLLTHDTRPIVSSQHKLASLDEYVKLLHAQDKVCPTQAAQAMI